MFRVISSHLLFNNGFLFYIIRIHDYHVLSLRVFLMIIKLNIF